MQERAHLEEQLTLIIAGLSTAKHFIGVVFKQLRRGGRCGGGREKGPGELVREQNAHEVDTSARRWLPMNLCKSQQTQLGRGALKGIRSLG